MVPLLDADTILILINLYLVIYFSREFVLFKTKGHVHQKHS